MDSDSLEKKLNQGGQWGFRKETNDPNYLGWILIVKYKPPILYSQELYKDEAIYIRVVRKHEKITKSPYHVHIVELKREVHESDNYQSEDDYRQRENYYFSTLNEVEEFITKLGYSFDNIKRRDELDAP